MPFGDHGFVPRAATLRRLGGFDESVPSGEDHRLVWQARAADTVLTPYWTAAECAGLEDPSWRNFSRLWQGEGELGARMERVCETLQQRHGKAFLIGAAFSVGDTAGATPAVADCDRFHGAPDVTEARIEWRSPPAHRIAPPAVTNRA